MKQVFFKTVDALEAAASTAGDARFSDLEKGKLGLWCLDAATGGDWFASALFENRFVIADTDDDDGSSTAVSPTLTMSGGLMLKDKIQIVQGYGSANPIASPIIHTSDIVRVTCAHYEASARHEVRVTPAGTDIGSDEMNLKIIVRKQPTGYLDYVNGEDTIADLSGGNFQFPLGTYNTTNHKVFNIGFSAGANVAGTVDNLITALTGNDLMNKMFTTTDEGATGADILARHAGVVFECILENITDDTFVQGSLQQAFKPGTGNDWQARTDELKARAQFGNFNRMYFPDTVTDFVANDAQFDRFEIIYKINGDWGPVKGSLYGSAVIYETTAQDDVKDVLNLGTAPTAGTVVEHVFGRSH